MELELDCDAARRDSGLLCLPGHGKCPCCVVPRAPAERGGCLPADASSRDAQGCFTQDAYGLRAARSVACRRCSGSGQVLVRHVAPLLLLPLFLN